MIDGQVPRPPLAVQRRARAERALGRLEGALLNARLWRCWRLATIRREACWETYLAGHDITVERLCLARATGGSGGIDERSVGLAAAQDMYRAFSSLLPEQPRCPKLKWSPELLGEFLARASASRRGHEGAIDIDDAARRRRIASPIEEWALDPVTELITGAPNDGGLDGMAALMWGLARAPLDNDELSQKEDWYDLLLRLLSPALGCHVGATRLPVLFLGYGLTERRSLFGAARHLQLGEWAPVFVASVADSAEAASVRLDRIGKTEAWLRRRLERADRKTAALREAVSLLWEEPTVTTPLLRDRLVMTQRGAQVLARRLENLGVLDEIGSRPRDRVFTCAQITAIP